jgi:hypothetical protein
VNLRKCLSIHEVDDRIWEKFRVFVSRSLLAEPSPQWAVAVIFMLIEDFKMFLITVLSIGIRTKSFGS